MDLTAVDVTAVLGLVSMWLLTANIVLGTLIATRYNTVRQWPHRRVNIFKIHNVTAYLAIGTVLLHPLVLLFSKTAGFTIGDILFPIHSPGQVLYNCLGAFAFYLLLTVVITSYLRKKIGFERWKKLHYLTYLTAAVVFTHGILTDPNLKNQPTDFLDGEKIQGEVCLLIVITATVVRTRRLRTASRS